MARSLAELPVALLLVADSPVATYFMISFPSSSSSVVSSAVLMLVPASTSK